MSWAMPNTFAYIMLACWPIVAIALFATMTPPRALVWGLLGGYLLLPVKTAFDFPGIPSIDKTSIVNLSVLGAALLFSNGRVLRLPREWWLIALMLVYVCSPIMTVRGNPDTLVFGSTLLPRLRPYDALSMAGNHIIELIPVVMGYNIFNTTRARHELLRGFAIAILGYSVLMLVEVRLSPQFHNWVYGFFPHSFFQQIRDGGFRPVVFLGHGLQVAIFAAIGTIAASHFAKLDKNILSLPARIWVLYLLLVVFLCRSLGPLILLLGALSILALFRAKRIFLICALIAGTVLIYPALRSSDMVPVQWVADQAAHLDQDRAASFQTRVDNENALLAKANKRPLFGWGGYARNHVYDEINGRDLSITDGEWIIVIGTFGWIGYLAKFGLLCLPVITAWRSRELTSAEGATLALLLTVNILDSLPNASIHNYTWLLVGTLAAARTSKSRAKPLPFTERSVA